MDLLPEGLWDQAREAGLMIVNGSGPRLLEKGFNRREHHAWLQDELSKQLELAAQYQVLFEFVGATLTSLDIV